MNPFEKLYKGKVMDTIQKKNLFDKEGYVNNADIRENQLNNLFREGIRKRGEHERYIRSILERIM